MGGCETTVGQGRVPGAWWQIEGRHDAPRQSFPGLKEAFEAMWAGEGDADAVIEKRGLKQIIDSGVIEKAVVRIIAANPKQLEQYRAGKETLFGYFVGQVMKATQGKANPAQVNDLLKEKLAP